MCGFLIKREYGLPAIFYGNSSHQLWGNIGYRFSNFNRFRSVIGGSIMADSGEGWYPGGIHSWGSGAYRWNTRMFAGRNAIVDYAPAQTIQRLYLREAIMEGKAEWYANCSGSIPSASPRMGSRRM